MGCRKFIFCNLLPYPFPFPFPLPLQSPCPKPQRIMLSALVEATDWTLEISPDRQAALGQHRSANTNWGRWNANLNHLCLETILPWLQAEYLPTATAWVAASVLPMVWDVVTGAVIIVGTKRIALIPTESIDRSELEVPQEWVDIPSWAADYYLGIQVDSSAGEIHIYGYTTHQQLKTQGSYDPIDRTYCLDSEELNADLNALWLTIDRYPQTATRAEIDPIPTIASERVAPLLDRLSNPTEIIPRLAVPFELWAAIIENPESLQRLYQHRQAGRSTPAVTRLSDWLQGRIDTVWQALDLVLLPPQIATAVRGDRSTPVPSDFYRAKVYAFATGQIALVIGISPISDTDYRIGLQIHPAGGSTQLPGATQLRLSAAGSEIGRASATSTETIQFQFRASANERFEIEIDCGGETRVESFEL
jgi:Protein of unknown function (DUF1822)